MKGNCLRNVGTWRSTLWITLLLLDLCDKSGHVQLGLSLKVHLLLHLLLLEGLLVKLSMSDHVGNHSHHAGGGTALLSELIG
eukprot:Gb_02143 [translate_table: standard]